MTTALTVKDLTRVYPGGGGVRGIGFTADEHAVTAVIGPNGAGKTVLFSIIAGLAQAESGTVDFASPKARVAYCPDVPQFESWLTALEVVETSLAVSRESTGRVRIARGTGGDGFARGALEACGLGSVMDRRVADFSRGMLQRLGIAAALVTDPEILILDEPNSALDPIGRADVRDIITEQKRHRCILLSSHMLSEVEQLADHIVVIDQGRVVTRGTTASILTDGLEPVWTIRLGAPAQISAADLAVAVPEARFEFETDTLCTARFRSFEAAGSQLMTALHIFRSPVIEVTLRDRDLDASFARIVQNQEHR
ncbi:MULTISPECIES: ABC transporter ATP-binding protein [Micrococcales]|uniref:Daunorubicin/doxorubicin resistance ATP-binding protein DrrA n=2 Tax=Micrococcales TaxID=85006 RepID=A0A449D9L5_9MICO|nr:MULTISPECIES: ABC transporter ATP-binding protein [Micrococcales]MBP2407788.1 ABC-2 type transport system ATP-binding protein [Brachybacterium fresconis]VEW14249.1 Daunorubicin/doxorubicin resistance ATP-binding protein DrrA [Brevibacterium casei]